MGVPGKVHDQTAQSHFKQQHQNDPDSSDSERLFARRGAEPSSEQRRDCDDHERACKRGPKSISRPLITERDNRESTALAPFVCAINVIQVARSCAVQAAQLPPGVGV